MLDSLSVVPGTLQVSVGKSFQPVDTNSYTLKPYESILIWKKKPAADTVVNVIFRVYPFTLAGATYHKSYAAYVRATAASISHPFVYNPVEGDDKLIDFGSLDYNGSFSRSVSVGSNQDLALNSVFNLQLSGMLSHDIELTAAITDNNIPIQPEGNTQNIQEFDKVFIQIRKDQHKVIVGDFDLNSPDDYFLKFARKYEGGYYSGAYKVTKLGILKTAVAAGISRGKFASNTLVVSDGNQGPYQLVGADGETVITVLSNSESVFVNGEKLTRGADRDYTIDYNLAEVTFTPKRMVTADMRVVVEFQYANNDYTRSGVFLSNELITKKVDLRFNLFSEQDSKGQNVQQPLTPAQTTFLAGLGDSIQKAYVPGFDTSSWNANIIMYRMVDTAVFPFHFDSVFVYSTDSTKAKYTVSFSYVGQGLGDYVASTSAANGRVYQWVVPVYDTLKHAFVPQGQYEPSIFLVTPKYQQMYTLAADYHIDKNNTISAEGAMSNTDQNMFAPDDNKIGFAGHLGYKGTFTTQGDSLNGTKQTVTLEAGDDLLQHTFSAVDRFRNVEFSRDWNMGNNTTLNTNTVNQNLFNAGVTYAWKGLGSINYQFKALNEDTMYHGYDNQLNGNFAKNGFNFAFTNSYLSAYFDGTNSNFVRPKGDFWYASKKTKGWKIGAQYDNEVNLFKDKGTDTLTSTSYIWQNYKVYIASPDSQKTKYRIEFTQRDQQRPDSITRMFGKPYYQAEQITFTGTVNKLKNQTLIYSLTYRHAYDADSVGISEAPDNYYLGRIDYTVTAAKGAIRSQTLYEIGTGRQQRSQITYEVDPNNQGNYIWVDLNHDGVKEINEFILSPPPHSADTSYDQIIIPTPEYASVNTNQFTEVLNINPGNVWKNAKGAKGVLSKFSILGSLQLNKKTYVDADKRVYQYFNPFPLASDDTSIVSLAMSSRNTLYFNKLDPKYGAQFDYNYQRSRTYLTGGFDNHFAESEDVLVRWNIVKPVNFQATYTYGIKGDQSDFFVGQQYQYHYNDVSTDLSYQIQNFLRFDLKYEFTYDVNPTDTVGNQTALLDRITLEARYNKLKKSTITGTFSYVSINYNDKGYENDQLEYSMLNGLLGGNNLVWGLNFTQSLIKNIQLTISYDGRMTGFIAGEKSTYNLLNTARAELRALF